MNNIYLTGFMGTGKTAVGKELARRKQWQFVDLDGRIEAKESRSITDIFAKDGEAYFRRVETDHLREVSAGKNQVIACGGGIVIDPQNIALMEETGMIICLSARPEVILKRTAGYAHRPLLNVDEPRQKIEELLVKRAPFYACADATVDTSEQSIQEVVEAVLKIVEE